MPHRKNAKGDIGTAKMFSDSYDMDNIYLTEEGWVYRHFKNTDRTLWWDEIIVAGQVKPDMSIHGVSNGPGVTEGTGRGVAEVVLTNPLKLGTVTQPSFQKGDGVFDYRYSDHVGEDIDGDLSLDDPIFDEDQEPGGDPPAPDPNPTAEIGKVTIDGPRNFGTDENETFTWSVTGGDFTKAELTHRWFIIDKSNVDSGMAGEAELAVAATEEDIYVTGKTLGSIKVAIEVTADAANSPVVVEYNTSVV